MSEHTTHQYEHSSSHHSHSHHRHKRDKNDISEWKRRSLNSLVRKKKIKKLLFNILIAISVIMFIAVIIAYTIG
ncbi:MAG: hypothetical protein J6B91_00500 [Prevotella sp.]|nr:hypothetical protein [Prevotella sp.]